MKQIGKFLLKVWRNLEEIILIPALTVSIILIFVQVIMRYVFNNSLSWSEELARFMYIWEVWIGISLCVKNHSHLRITLIYNVVKGRGAVILDILVNVLWFVFGLLLIKYGQEAVIQILGFNQKSTALKASMGVVYSGIPLGALLMNIRLVEDTVRLVKKFMNYSEEEGGANA